MDPALKSIAEAKKSIFRFEGLQDYSAEDGEEFVRTYIEKGIFTIQPKDNSWCKDMKQRIERGVKAQRVRLVLKPLNDYTRAELAWHKAVAEFTGDDIRVIEEKDFKEIAPDGLADYWMTEDTNVFILNYGPQGKYLSCMRIPESQVKKYIELKNKLLDESVSILKYSSD